MIPLNMSSAGQEGIPSNDLTNRIDGLLDAGQFLNMMKIYERDYLSDSCDSEEDEELSVSVAAENVSASAEKDVETLYNNLSTYELEIDKERFMELEKMLMECDDVIKESDKHLGSLESFKKTISLTFSESDEDDVEDLELLEICGSEMSKGDNHQSTEDEFTENGSDEKVLGSEIIPAISNKISDLTKLLQVQLAETDETYEKLRGHQSRMQQEINENSARLDNERKDILAQLEDEKAEHQREKEEKEAAMCRWEEDHQNEVKEELAAQQIHIQALEELMATQKETADVLAQIQQDERKKREMKSAVKIQSTFRMHRTKKEYRIVQEKRRKEEERKFEKEQENKRRQAEEEKIKREKEEEMKKEEKRKAEEEKKKKAEEARRKMLDEEEKKKREEEEERKKKKEEEEKKKKEEEERKKMEEEERMKREEEERKKREEEEKKKREEEEERKKKEEEERKKKEEEERKKREEEERKKREEEERKKKEEKMKREVEEKKKEEEQEKKEREEEKRKKDAEERIKRDGEERRKKEEERIRKEEEERKMKENDERMKREKDEEEARMKREEEEEVKKKREEEEKTKEGEERKKEAAEEGKRGGNGETKKGEEESKIKEVEKKRPKEEEKEEEQEKDLAREEVDEEKQKSLREVEEKVMSEAESLQKIEREIQKEQEEDMKTKKEEEPIESNCDFKMDLYTGLKHSVNVESKNNNIDTDGEGGSRKMLGEDKMAADKKEAIKEGKRKNEKIYEEGVNGKEMGIEKNEEREGLKKEADNVLCWKMDDKDGENESIEVEDRNIKINDKVQVLTLSSKNDQKMDSVMKTWDSDKVYLQPLPQILNVRRLAWMENCLPWGKISNQPWIGDKKNHALTKSERKRPPSNKRLPKPLNEEVILSVTKCTSLMQVTSIHLKNLNGFTLTTLGQCLNLEYLSVNNCQLLILDGLQICSQVKYIDVKNNNIEYVNVKGMESLRVLDLSYNNLALIHGLDDCSNLLWLNLQHNRITKFGSGLKSLRRLHTLLLGHNQLISTSGLQIGGVELQTLDLSHNQLQYVTDIEKFCLLRSLDVSGNNLIETPNLKNHVLMQDLQLSDNCLSSLTELSECWLPLLRVLNLGQNRLSALPPMEYVHSLKMIDIANNQLLDFAEIMKAFSNCKQVERFTLHGNPLSAEEEDMRKQMIGVFPRLRYWDSCPLVENQLTLSSKNSSDNGFQLLCAKQADVFEKLQHNFHQKIKEVSESDLLGACNAHVNWCQESLRIATECRYAHEYGEISARMFPSVDESVEQVQGAELILTDTDTSEIVAKMTSPATYHDLCCHTAGKSQDTCPKGQASEAHLDRSGHDHPMVVAPGPTTLQEHATTATPGSAKHSQTREDHRLSPQTGVPSEDYETSQKNQRVFVKRPNHLNSNQNDVVLAKRNKAATRIQAAWRGFSLRVKLQAALQFAQNVYEEESEFGEEIDLESFDMAEADLEKTWTVSDSPAPPTNLSVLSQPPLFRDSSHLQLGFPISQDESRSNPDENRSLAHPREAWNSPVVSARSNLPLSGVFRPKSTDVLRLSPPSTSTSGNRGEGDFPDVMSRCKDDAICKEWGFKDARTAQMMLQRAKKMKFNAERREKLKKLDPRQRLALFRKLGEVTPLMPVKSPSRKMLPKKEYFQARQQNMGLNIGYFEMMTKEEQNKIKESRTYQWIHTQISPFDNSDQRSQQSFTANSSQSSKKPLDTSQRVILYQKHQVTGAGLFVGDTSEQSQSLVESECRTVRGHRRHSTPTSAKRPVHLPPIDRSSPSTMRREGSMSHWKPDVRKSGGWGGGKKRNKGKKSPNVSDVH